ncbi:MAG: nucleotide sugar dehydrogenase [Deltaproteobacteria bacterium]|nr:nucleotide sugar dehydrogenase [Deltaproteobacteria bacterium]
MSSMLQRIQSREAQVAVIGIGYVGLPLVVEVAKAGFRVVGYDKSAEKAQSVNAGRSYIKDVPTDVLAPLVSSGKVKASNDPDVLAQADVVIICVPTPLNKTKDPDNSFIMAAADDLAPRLHKDTLVILESTTFPGFTREVLVPRLEDTGLKVGRDVFVAFSPERVDPGNAKFHTKNTPKVIGGVTPQCLEVAHGMYREVMETIVPVSSTDAAEMVKLLENTFRAVNIGLVNEVAIMCQRLGLNTWEVIDAAATKPFGYMPFYPGPGLGGHCIPVDPLYLSWKLKTLKYNARFIELAGEINSGMPEVVVARVANSLNQRERAVKGSKILVLGVAYKRDIDDVRESPALDVIELLEERGAHVSFHDPFIPSINLGKMQMDSVPLVDLGSFDAVVIVTDHTTIDYAQVTREARLIIDTRNATKALRNTPDAKQKIVTI